MSNETGFMEKLEQETTKAKQKAKKGFGAFVKWGKAFGLGFLVGALIAALVFNFGSDLFKRSKQDKDTTPEQLEDHDLTLEDDLFGYVAADFAEAILGQSNQAKKLTVYEIAVSDVVKLTDAGLGNLKIFSKYQYITYHGTASYYVDLSQMQSRDIDLDKDDKTLTIYIPRPILDEINTPADKMEFQDVEKGILSFGDIKVSPENQAKVEIEANNKMKAKLESENVLADAERFAILSVWEIFQPIISEMNPKIKVVVAFQN